MAFRQKRQARFESLISLGFLYREAFELSAMPRSIPYLQELAAQRYAERLRWERAGKTEAEWRTHIKRRYNIKWGRSSNAGAVWAMLRETGEKPYKERHPEYVQHYPKKSHHKDGEITNHKLKNAMGKRDYDGEIAEMRRQISTFSPDAPIVRHLESQIKRVERERDR